MDEILNKGLKVSGTSKYSVIDTGSGKTAPAPASSSALPPSAPPVCEDCSGTYHAPKVFNGHPKWHMPKGSPAGDEGLMVNNTLTGSLVPFRPLNGRQVKWYTCGPTVYDHSHMGHARAYLTFDILRRIMQDYFHYEIIYHSNITDIDDKIIMRARRNFLLDEYMKKNPSMAETTAAIDAALSAAGKKLDEKLAALKAENPTDSRAKSENENEIKMAELKISQLKGTMKTYELIKLADKDGIDKAINSLAGKGALASRLEAVQKMLFELADEEPKGKKAEEENKAKMTTAQNLQTELTALKAFSDDGGVKAAVGVGKDALGEALDKELGDTVTDHNVFDAHCRKFEADYFEDMRALGIQDPDILTRVTEYVPQIVDYVKKIVDRGMAYASNGSVYLDTVAFKAAGNDYRKNVPGDETSAAMMEESEGKLGGGDSEKKHPNDFALWKASKRGEPFWESPWGDGRPGWHIECSVVASDILGENMDIHAGGNDLKFPHHDNELAQSEAYHGCCQWVNYFFHCGHLHIAGLKMSKSLKNFITIKQALKEHSPRQIRLMFLLQPWDKPMNYSDQTVGDAKTKEALFKNFFGQIKALLREDQGGLNSTVGFRRVAEDRALTAKLQSTQQLVHRSFQNNFDTKTAVLALVDLVSFINKYLEEPEGCIMLLNRCAMYITSILRVLGVVEGGDAIGFPMGGEGGGDKETVTGPYIDAIVSFRDKVRALSRAKADPVEFLKLCDEIRDTTMVDLGVALEDRTDAATIWKMSDPEALRKDIADRKKKQAEVARKKKQNQLDTKLKTLKKWQSAGTAPAEYFKKSGLYTAYDDKGIPTQKKGEDKPLAKGQMKKLGKELAKHSKEHANLQKESGGDVEAFLAKLQAEVNELEASL